jgi:peroxiredoxin
MDALLCPPGVSGVVSMKLPVSGFYLSVLTVLTACSATHPDVPAAEVRQALFSGTLLQSEAASDDSDGDILRRFEVSLFRSDAEAFFVVADDLRHGCPWPDSYGLTGPGTSGDGVHPHLVYDYDGTTYVIPLPPLLVQLPERVAADLEWEQSGWLLHAVSETTHDGKAAWIVEAAERRGRRQTLVVDDTDGTVLKAEADVFMGQGEQFRLAVLHASDTLLDADTTAALQETQRELLAVQSGLRRRPDGFQRELSARQVTEVQEKLPRILSAAATTPLKSLVTLIETDLGQQQKRMASAANQAERWIGTAAPPFELALARGGALNSAKLTGQPIVLHFWDYRDSPLSEPYGQIGYLEFLYNQSKAGGLQVVGVSTNQELQSAEHRARGLRSIRKLAEFMNLTYPVGHDDGTLLNTFGDPREARGQLPLWIVINGEGKVVHYHSGLYEVDAAQGLKQLEEVLAGLTKSPGK